MAKCPYNSSSEYCEIEVQLEVAKVAENEATETFHEMDAEIRRLLQRIELLEKTLQQYNIPISEVEDCFNHNFLIISAFRKIFTKVKCSLH